MRKWYTDIIPTLTKRFRELVSEVYVFWSHGDNPAIMTDLHRLLDNTELLTQVSPDQFILCPE
jgi:hypothetical protein